jgi:hypothetical protein
MSKVCEVRKNESGELVDERIPVRVNQGQSVDAVLARRRASFLFRIYYDLRGIHPVDQADADDIEGVIVQQPEPVSKPQIANLEDLRRTLKFSNDEWESYLLSRAGVRELGELSRDAAEVMIVDLRECLEKQAAQGAGEREPGQEGEERGGRELE